LKLPSLKGKSKIKERECLSSLGRAKEISIKERQQKSIAEERHQGKTTKVNSRRKTKL
jgi:hypothetical protein